MTRTYQQIADAIAAALRPIAPGGALRKLDVEAINAMAVGWEQRESEQRQPRIVSAAGEALVKEFEGLRLTAYPDPASGGDPWTIGYGATGEGIHRGIVWTQAHADTRLSADLARFAMGVAAAIGPAPTTQNEFDAMVSLAFNIGKENFKESTLLRMHQDGDKAGAAGQFARWNRADGKVMAGLTRRRAAEAKLYRGA